MKKLSSRAIAAITNALLALILVVVGTVCFYPSATGVSGTKDRVYYKGSSPDGVTLMFNVYWGTELVYKILDVLDDYEAKATFFLGGSWADDNVDCVKEIVARGQEVGSHGYFHRDHAKLSFSENYGEIKNSVDFIEAACGAKVLLFAPPSGAFNDDTVLAAEELGLKTVMWSKDTIDWRDKDRNIAYRKATQEIKGGDLVLMHPMEHTLAALPNILQYYCEKGLRAVTAGENLLGSSQ